MTTQELVSNTALALHSGTDEALSLGSLGAKVEDVIELAIKRGADKMIEEGLVKQVRAYKVQLEAFSAAPETYNQFAVQYLLENRAAVISSVQANLLSAGERRTMSSFVVECLVNQIIFPAVNDKIAFTDVDAWRPQLSSNDISKLGLFLNKALVSLLHDLCMLYCEGMVVANNNHSNTFMLKNGNRKVVNARFSNNALASLLESQGLREKIKQDVTLKGIIAAIQEICGRFTPLNKFDNFSDRLKKSNISKDLEGIIANVGLYIYDRMKHFDIEEHAINVSNAKEVGEVIDHLLGALSGIRGPSLGSVEQPVIGKFGFLPDLQRLDLVKAELRIHMIRVGIHNRFYSSIVAAEDKSKALDKEFFQGLDKRVFKEEGKGVAEELSVYEKAPAVSLWGESKRSLRKKYEGEVIAEEVKSLYDMAAYIHKLYEVGMLYSTMGQERQKKYGVVLEEVSKIYAERLSTVAVNLEVKLKIGDFKTDELGQAIASLTGLLDSKKLEDAIGSALSADHAYQGALEAEKL